MKTVLFVPGFFEDIDSRDYRRVLKLFEDNGYKAVFVPTKWEYTTLHDWHKECMAAYEKYDSRTTCLAGFSYGAMTAFSVAAERPPAELWLFSLSPYFSDDIDTIPQKELTYIGKRRAKVFSEVSFTTLADNISCPVFLFYGDSEYKRVIQRVEKAHKIINNSSLIRVPDTRHDVTAPRYLEKIESQLLKSI